MRIQTTRSSAAALTLAGLLVVQGCSQWMPKLTQEVPVTSNPMGATISVDGKPVGQSPLTLTLKKNRSHTVRIEMEGYRPTELRVLRKMTVRAGLSVLAVPVVAVGTGLAVFLAQLIATNAEKSYKTYNRTFTTTVWISGAVATAALIVDMTSGADHSLSPRTLDVSLTKADRPGPLRVNVIQLDAAQFQDIQWIRINLGTSRQD